MYVYVCAHAHVHMNAWMLIYFLCVCWGGALRYPVYTGQSQNSYESGTLAFYYVGSGDWLR